MHVESPEELSLDPGSTPGSSTRKEPLSSGFFVCGDYAVNILKTSPPNTA